MSKPRFFKPGQPRGTFYVNRKDKPDLKIGPSGVAISDSDTLDLLDNHVLKGYQRGFIEVKSLKMPKVVANSLADDEVEQIPEKDDDLSIAETKSFIKNNDLSDKEIVVYTQGDERSGIQKIHDAAQKRLDKKHTNGEGDEDADVVVKEDIANINQLKDYVQDQAGIDGRKLTTPDKITEAAQQLTPPHEFPNLDVSG